MAPGGELVVSDRYVARIGRTKVVEVELSVPETDAVAVNVTWTHKA